MTDSAWYGEGMQKMKFVSMAVVLLLCSPVLAGETKPLAVLNQSDISELSRILDEQVPQRWGKPIVEFVNRIIARQQERDKAEAAAKPEEAK